LSSMQFDVPPLQGLCFLDYAIVNLLMVLNDLFWELVKCLQNELFWLIFKLLEWKELHYVSIIT